MSLLATVLNSANTKHFYHHKKILLCSPDIENRMKKKIVTPFTTYCLISGTVYEITLFPTIDMFVWTGNFLKQVLQALTLQKDR